jgi:hypothetical protein
VEVGFTELIFCGKGRDAEFNAAARVRPKKTFWLFVVVVVKAQGNIFTSNIIRRTG